MKHRSDQYGTGGAAVGLSITERIGKVRDIKWRR